MLADATSKNPEFTPDIPGNYVVEVTDLGEAEPSIWAVPSGGAAETVTLNFYADLWRGVIVGQDA